MFDHGDTIKQSRKGTAMGCEREAYFPWGHLSDDHTGHENHSDYIYLPNYGIICIYACKSGPK